MASAACYLGSFHTYGMPRDGNQAKPYLDGQAYPAGANRDTTRLDQILILDLGAGPIPASSASMTPSRSISSPTASTPADPVNEASGAPNLAVRRADFPVLRGPRNFSTWKVPLSRGQIGSRQP